MSTSYFIVLIWTYICIFRLAFPLLDQLPPVDEAKSGTSYDQAQSGVGEVPEIQPENDFFTVNEDFVS